MSNKNDGQSFLAGVGIDVDEVGTPFWKPSSRKQTVTITDARAPTEPVKEFTDSFGNVTKLRILAEIDLEAEGVPHRWEVTGKRALAALDAQLDGVPCDLLIWEKGTGQAKQTFIEKVTATKSATCKAPGCIKPDGHPGSHQAKKVKA